MDPWVGSLGLEDPLEEGVATHSSILAWRIPRDRGAWGGKESSQVRHAFKFPLCLFMNW